MSSEQSTTEVTPDFTTQKLGLRFVFEATIAGFQMALSARRESHVHTEP
jgi:hypothetical protein